jgi:hypothetical protein
MDEPATALPLPTEAGALEPLPPLIRPCRVWACRAINQDLFWFFHVDARPADFAALYAYGATFRPPLFTSMGWNEDHLLVHANALYVADDPEPTTRFARPLLALVQYYDTLRRLGGQFPPWEP